MMSLMSKPCSASNSGVIFILDDSRWSLPRRRKRRYNLPPAFKAARQGRVRLPTYTTFVKASVIAPETRQLQLVDIGGARTAFIAPLLREGNLVGVITIFRQDVKPFTDKQIKLVANFCQSGRDCHRERPLVERIAQTHARAVAVA
jgi:hypothetical protein